MAIQGVKDILARIDSIHEKKNQDYAAPGSEFENFERSALIAEWFNERHDKVFITLVATKLSRLATLLNSEREPNNESIADSFLDLATYSILWAAHYESRLKTKKRPINYDAVNAASLTRESVVDEVI